MQSPDNFNSTFSLAASLKWLTAVVLLINLFVLVLTGVSLYQSRHQYEVSAEVTTQNLALVFEQYVGGSTHKIDVILLAAVDEIEKRIAQGGIDRRELNGFLVRQSERLPELDGVRMANNRGEIVFGPGVTGGIPKSIADRDYFIGLRDKPNAGLFISKPLVSRVIAKWSVILARRINNPDGSFAGVVYGVIPLQYFYKIFSSVDVGKYGAITLRGADMGVIARHYEPYAEDSTVGGKTVSGKLSELIKSGRNIGTYKALAPVDGIERIYTFRKFSDYPLLITVGLATKEYLADWRREVAIMSSLVALFVLLTLIAAWRIGHEWKRKKAALDALTEQEKKYRTLFEESKDTILISDPAGQILDTNQAGIELFGYSKEELFVLDPERLYCNVGERKRLWTELIISGFVDDFVVEMRCKSGKEISVNLSVSVIRDEEGKVFGHRGIARDVTERKRLERQLMQAQKMESIGLLAGGVAHDFNNLLTVISGYGVTIRENSPADNELLQDSAEQILKAAERATELAKSLLAFSRKQVIHPKPVQVNTIICDTGKLIKRIIGEDIEFRTSFSDRELPVMVDAGQIEQVLMNLATNARDAMPNGGHLHISTLETVVSKGSESQYDVAKPGKYACISVFDNGVGIDEKSLGRIFEPFYTTKDVGKGTGLGLSMIYGAVKQHKGSVLVKSEPGKGTVFNIYLPVIEDVDAFVEKQVATAPPAVVGTETLLIAEDEEMVRTFMQKIFKRAGYNVIAAIDGNDAVAKFRENRESISLVLSDMIMPGKNGVEILEEVRKIKPDAKVLFISGYTANVLHEKGILEEDIDYITKPFAKEKLLQKVREILDKN